MNEHNFLNKGYFIEIGAADGKYLSNTYMLEKDFNWSGLVVEPAKMWAQEIVKNRNVIFRSIVFTVSQVYQLNLMKLKNQNFLK